MLDETYKGDDEINREDSLLQGVDDSFLITLKIMTHTINSSLKMQDISSEFLLDSGIIAFSFKVFQQQDIEDQIFLTQFYYKLINHTRHIFLTLFLNQTFFDFTIHTRTPLSNWTKDYIITFRKNRCDYWHTHISN